MSPSTAIGMFTVWGQRFTEVPVPVIGFGRWLLAEVWAGYGEKFRAPVYCCNPF